eukprot:808350-Rhodomonas_salina.2
MEMMAWHRSVWGALKGVGHWAPVLTAFGVCGCGDSCLPLGKLLQSRNLLLRVTECAARIRCGVCMRGDERPKPFFRCVGFVSVLCVRRHICLDRMLCGGFRVYRSGPIVVCVCVCRRRAMPQCHACTSDRQTPGARDRAARMCVVACARVDGSRGGVQYAVGGGRRGLVCGSQRARLLSDDRQHPGQVTALFFFFLFYITPVPRQKLCACSSILLISPDMLRVVVRGAC